MPCRTLFPALLLPLTLAIACGGDDESPKPWLPDSSELTTTWKTGTAVLDEATIEDALTNPDATDGVYRFKPGTQAASALTENQFALFTGVDVVKVVSVTTQADAIVVTTKPASLTDLAEEAKGTWNLGVEFAPRTSASEQSMLQRALAPFDPLDKAKLVYNGPLGQFTFTGHLTPGPETLGLTGLVDFRSGQSLLKVAIDGTLKRFRHSGDVSIRDGKLESFYLSVDELDLDLTLKLGAVALKTGDQTFRVPVEVVLPFTLNGIPLYISIGLYVNINAALSTQSTSRAEATFHIRGGGSFRYDAQGLAVNGSFAQSTMEFGEHEAVSTIDSGFGFLAEFPRIGLGLGNPKIGASLGGYITLRTEVVANMKMKYDTAGPYPVIVGNCYEAKQNFGVYAGGEFRLAGIRLTKESSLYTKVTTAAKTGDACK